MKRSFSITKRDIEGMALNIKLALGFFHLMFFFRIILNTEDLKIDEAIHLTIRIHIKYEPVISYENPF